VSLRQKTFLTVSIGVFLLMLTVYVLLSGRTLQSALNLEQQDLERNLVRAKNVILEELTQLELTTLDWAVFDETYNFVLGNNPKYAERNLTKNLDILDLEFFIIQKRDQVILSRQRVLDSVFLVPSSIYSSFVEPWNWLWSQTNQNLQRMTSFAMTSGLVSWGNSLYFVARAPIVSSSIESPTVGQLTMLRLLDIDALKQLSKLTQVKVSVIQSSLNQLSAVERGVAKELMPGQSYTSRVVSDSAIRGYTLLFERASKPLGLHQGSQVLLLEVEAEREGFLAAREFLTQLAWSLGLIGVLVTALMIGLLEFGLLSRLTGLHKELGQIANSGDIAHRLTVRGVDELGKLTQQINSSLSRVEETQVRSVQLEAKLERLRNTELAASLEETRLELFERLARIAEFRDNETGLHTGRVGEISYALAQELKLPPEECERLRYASRLHDIGKIAIPDSILFKPSGLDTQEWVLMQTHATLGGQMLEGSGSPLLEMARLIATTHHERWNGSGYPNGLQGEEIPLLGRIVGVADTLDALTSTRPYKPAWNFQDALDEIVAHSGHLFDPKVVEALLKIAPSLPPKNNHETTA
jgi:HD-GYP domain-containing protein (c-di-GMP phosphodiesterase class II)/sensor domain CHASE-containing protein